MQSQNQIAQVERFYRDKYEEIFRDRQNELELFQKELQNKKQEIN